MGDDKDKPGGGGAQEPPLVDGLPDDLKKFLDCVANEVKLKPGKQAWLKNIPEVGGLLENAEINFDSGPNGSVKVTAGFGKDSYVPDTSISMNVDADGNLAIDTSSSMVINAFKDKVNDWTGQLNKWVRSKGKKFGKPTIKGGVVTFTKVDGTAVAPAPKDGGVKRGLFPNVPIGEKIGAGALFGFAIIGAVAWLPSDHTTVKTAPATIAVEQQHDSTSTTEPAPTKPTQPPVVTPAPFIYAACWGYTHDQPGVYSVMHLGFTSLPAYAGPWLFVVQGPNGVEQGPGKMDETGRGEADIRITSFGTRTSINIVAPDHETVPPGPFAAMLPFTVDATPKPCNISSLPLPPAPASKPATNSEPKPEPKSNASASSSSSSAPASTATQSVKVTEHGGAPWSLLLIPGSAALLGGALVLDDERRARAQD